MDHLFNDLWATTPAGEHVAGLLGFDAIIAAVPTSPWTKAQADMQAQAGQPDANFGRWTLPVIPTNMLNMLHNWLVTARKE